MLDDCEPKVVRHTWYKYSSPSRKPVREVRVRSRAIEYVHVLYVEYMVPGTGSCYSQRCSFIGEIITPGA